MIPIPVLAQPPALVRVQEGVEPVAVGRGLAAAQRYVHSRFSFPRIDSSAWKDRFALNWIVGFDSTRRRVAFFANRRYVGSDLDFGNIGQVGQLQGRTSTATTFAETLFRSQDQRCCPKGRVIPVRLGWNGGRLVQTRPLLREGSEPAEGLQTPSRNIGCIFSRSPGYVRCDVRTGLRPPPPRPKGCDLDWAYGLEMKLSSRAKTFCAGDTALAQGPILAYGAKLRILGFTCLSRRDGLRCTNRAGHGFFLSRQRWRTF
jgi:hypothetical protein